MPKRQRRGNREVRRPFVLSAVDRALSEPRCPNQVFNVDADELAAALETDHRGA